MIDVLLIVGWFVLLFWVGWSTMGGGDRREVLDASRDGGLYVAVREATEDALDGRERRPLAPVVPIGAARSARRREGGAS